MPIVDWLPHYQRAWLSRDLIAGVTVWAVLVPESIAYASIAGVPAQYGLYTALGAATVFALLTGTRQVITGPSGPIAAVAASVCALVVAADSPQYLYSEIDDSDFTYFLLFNLTAIETALEETRKYVEQKAAEDMEIQQHVQGDFALNYRQRAILSRALKKPGAVFTFQSHANSHGVVRATARADRLDLCERGYLVKRKDGRQIVFLPAPDLRDRLASRAS